MSPQIQWARSLVRRWLLPSVWGSCKSKAQLLFGVAALAAAPQAQASGLGLAWRNGSLLLRNVFPGCDLSWEGWRLAFLSLKGAGECVLMTQVWGQLSGALAPQISVIPEADRGRWVMPGLGFAMKALVRTSPDWTLTLKLFNKLTGAPSSRTVDKASHPGFSPMLLQLWADEFDTGYSVTSEWKPPSSAFGLGFAAGETLPPILRLTGLGRPKEYLALRYLGVYGSYLAHSWEWNAGLGWASLDYSILRATFPFPWLAVEYRWSQ